MNPTRWFTLGSSRVNDRLSSSVNGPRVPTGLSLLLFYKWLYTSEHVDFIHMCLCICVYMYKYVFVASGTFVSVV